MLAFGARKALLSNTAWTPRQNWPSAASPGLWYSPGEFATLSQDSAGTSPATVVEQYAGLELDKRLGLVLTSEVALISAQTVQNGSGSVSGAIWSVAASGSFAGIRQTTSLASGGLYWVTGSWGGNASGRTITLNFGGTGGTVGLGTAVSGTLNGYFRCGSTPVNIQLYAGNSVQGDTFSFSLNSVRELPGNHSSQPSAPARPQIKLLDGVQCLSLDGLDDSLRANPITLGANIDLILAMRRTSATGALFFETLAGTKYLGAMDATTGAASASAGTPTYVVNGVDVPGGTATTRAQLAAAVPVGSWCVMEIRNADLSAWTALGWGAYTALPMGMGQGEMIVCPAGDAAARAKNRRWVGAKVGLSL